MSTTPTQNPDSKNQRNPAADSPSDDRGQRESRKQQKSPRLQRSLTFSSPPRITSVSRHNKLYRCPPTPPPEVQYDRERSFVLDCNAVSNISNDYSTANPKLGSVIPPYNAQLDPHVDKYFDFFGITKTLEKTGQSASHESIAGRVHDRFNNSGHGFRYLTLRNRFGSGHSLDEIRGHALFLADPKPVVNYNGLFGYRRNTPSLRTQPTIGTRKVVGNGVIPLGRFSSIPGGRPYAFYC